jgi:hypothetical protein
MDTTAPEARRAKRIKLSKITIEPAFQSRRAHLDPVTVNRYRGPIKASEGDASRIPFPPVTAAQLGSQLYLVDGFHRYEAHWLEEVPSILCDVVKVRSLEEARWLAAKGNLHHGKPMNGAEVREAFRRFILAKQHLLADPNANPHVVHQRPRAGVMTLGEIASLFGKAKSTVARWFEDKFPKEFRRLYAKDAERYQDKEWGGDRPHAALFLAPSTAELAEMSLENVRRLGNLAESPFERVRVTELVAETLAELALSWRVGVADLTVVFNGPFWDRTAKVRVEEVDSPQPALARTGCDEHSDF